MQYVARKRDSKRSIVYTLYIINWNIWIHVDEHAKPANETFSRTVDVVELEQSIYITRVVKWQKLLNEGSKKEKVSVFLWRALEKKVYVNVRGKKEGELTEKVILIMIH